MWWKLLELYEKGLSSIRQIELNFHKIYGMKCLCGGKQSSKWCSLLILDAFIDRHWIQTVYFIRKYSPLDVILPSSLHTQSFLNNPSSEFKHELHSLKIDTANCYSWKLVEGIAIRKLRKLHARTGWNAEQQLNNGASVSAETSKILQKCSE